jgi:hypothetical protein
VYVEDMTLEDAQMFLAEYQAERDGLKRLGFSVPEALDWDIEDLEGRIEDLQFVAEYKRQINSAKQR